MQQSKVKNLLMAKSNVNLLAHLQYCVTGLSWTDTGLPESLFMPYSCYTHVSIWFKFEVKEILIFEYHQISETAKKSKL